MDTANVYYDPQEDDYIKDVSFAAGIRGTVGNNWDWDLSNVVGYNSFHYYGNKTFNAQQVKNVQPKTDFPDADLIFYKTLPI